MNNKTLFMSYSYFSTLLTMVLDLLPPFCRTIAFKIMFKKIGKDVLIDYKTYFRFPSKITIGDRVCINRGCNFYPSFHFKNSFIILKNDVVIGPGCTFFSAGQNYRSHDLPDIAESIVIEEGVYIGGESVIRYGVTIGKGAIVGAGSVVTKDVPENTIVFGVPARIHKKRTFELD